ncbi:MAG: hypothetical protein LBJ72_12595 [Dysgonamonadaceae bacterium]|jgi:hypothetical protein|nr:hypothetical protein [Dysgonamonadaceae bacterium]
MDIYGKIASKVKEIAGTGNLRQSIIFPSQVEKVEGSTCTVNLGEFLVSEVRLRAVINDNNEQLFIKPKEGSYVLVADLSGGDFRQLAVIAYSEVEAINIKIGEITIDIDEQEIAINGGKLDGLVKINDLLSKLNTIEKDINNLKKVFSTWVPVPNDGGSSLKGAISSWSGSELTETKKADIENKKIKQ